MVELTEEEKKLPYVKYFYRDLAKVPEEKLRIAQGAPADPRTALPLEERNRFLAGTDAGLTCGFTVMPDGLGYVANSTFMPNVTVEMCEWWFGWHSVGSDLRYKLWDHDDHYHARADKPDYVKDPHVPLAQKTWGVRHFIKEDIGFGPEEMYLCFAAPQDLGYDPALIGTDACPSLVCGTGEGKSPALMTHKFCSVPGGVQFVSRFWMGVGMKDGKVTRLLPEGARVPEAAPRALFSHNIKEFTNLASLLPALYAEEKDNW
ncbi:MULTISPECIES: DAPG hydrolase family protein [Caproicibacterium]|uniref:Phloretin hydrolase n=1 Tax=Caproicibacterium argilliputei TaxID=3030016 RepID=A0AA97DB00_9FIRM|nr:phloretin hydrolase [Caproicibacterium argilliputei]WOC32922.1 phloretin hydrolase [Caproicibacterium argilliputei]